MIIEIKSGDGRTLYGLEQSELIPDYCSVLREALILGIDLKGLVVQNKNLESLEFSRFQISEASFHDCSMKNVLFIDSAGDSLNFYNCNLSRIKFKRSKIEHLHFYDSDLNNARFRLSDLSDLRFDNCNLSCSEFHDCLLEKADFCNSNLRNVVFGRSSLCRARFVNFQKDDGWMQNVRLDNCRMDLCNLEEIRNVGVLHINNSNIEDALTRNEHFTRLSTRFMSILYAIESDLVWWNYRANSIDKFTLRGSLRDLNKEIDNNYPETLIPYLPDFFMEEWMELACKYLEEWKQS